MEDKKLTPQESMAVITQMIEATKQRSTKPDLRISVMWAVQSIVVALIILFLMMTVGDARVFYLWFAIPVIGIPLNILLARNKDKDKPVRTYIDIITAGIWKSVGFIGIALILMCIVFDAMGYPAAWNIMLIYAFVIVGFGAAMTGIVLKEGTYIFGGIFSILSGFVVMGVFFCAASINIFVLFGLFILSFLFMFVIPAIVIRRKSKV